MAIPELTPYNNFVMSVEQVPRVKFRTESKIREVARYPVK